jgi:hypothetical protein
MDCPARYLAASLWADARRVIIEATLDSGSQHITATPAAQEGFSAVACVDRQVNASGLLASGLTYILGAVKQICKLRVGVWRKL